MPERSWTPSEWQARFLPETSRYVLCEDDERFGLRAGDVLLCMRYWLDPGDKLTVVARESDGFEPMCNVYRSQVERLNAPARVQTPNKFDTDPRHADDIR